MVKCNCGWTCKDHLQFKKTIINEFKGYFKIFYFVDLINNKYFPTNFLKSICYGKQSFACHKSEIPYDVECFVGICIFFEILKEQSCFSCSPRTYYAYEPFIKIYLIIEKTLIFWYNLWFYLVWKELKCCYHTIS